MATGYYVLPLVLSSTRANVYTVNFDPSAVDIVQLRKTPKGSLLMQVADYDPDTCTSSAACAAFIKCSDGGACIEPVVTALATGGAAEVSTADWVDASAVALPADTWTEIIPVATNYASFRVMNASREIIDHQIELRIQAAGEVEARSNSAITVTPILRTFTA